MSLIACEGCGDVIDVQTKRIDLPFLCSECVTREETVDEGGMHDPKEDGQFDLDTQMIEDLQEQLEQANDKLRQETARAERYMKWYQEEYALCSKEMRKTGWRKLWEL